MSTSITGTFIYIICTTTEVLQVVGVLLDGLNLFKFAVNNKKRKLSQSVFDSHCHNDNFQLTARTRRPTW